MNTARSIEPQTLGVEASGMRATDASSRALASPGTCTRAASTAANVQVMSRRRWTASRILASLSTAFTLLSDTWGKGLNPDHRSFFSVGM